MYQAKDANEYIKHATEIVRAFVDGIELPHSGHYFQDMLYWFRERKMEVFASNSKEIPPLGVTMDGSNGMEIKAKFPVPTDHAGAGEGYRTIMCAPWSQFSLHDEADQRGKIALEIARRAVVHESLVKDIETLKKDRLELDKCFDEKDARYNLIFKMWKAERVALGKPDDFSDIDFSWTGEDPTQSIYK